MELDELSAPNAGVPDDVMHELRWNLFCMAHAFAICIRTPALRAVRLDQPISGTGAVHGTQTPCVWAQGCALGASRASYSHLRTFTAFAVAIRHALG